MMAQDQDVLHRLRLQPHQPISWQEVLEKIKKFVAPTDLPGICGRCPWLHLGVCAKGIAKIKI
jgi:hypothetical protein